jgi:hypothetical protein
MGLRGLQGKLALVTGASSGLGADFARQLAAHGCDLVLVARRRDRLEALAVEIRQKLDVRIDVIDADLGIEEQRIDLFGRLEGDGKHVDILINNAGFGVNGRFVDIPWDREEQMLQIDIVGLVHLTKLFVPGMVSRGFGRVLQVASIGAFQPTPTYASYSAAKSFVLMFGEALNRELSKTGVSCTVVSPGVTATEFLEVAGQTPTPYQRLMMMKSQDVVRIGLGAMIRGRSSIVPGLLNAISAWSMRFVPRFLATIIAGRMMR